MEYPKIQDEYLVKINFLIYLLERLAKTQNKKEFDSLKIVKLLALADIWRLRNDGQTISKDRYVALKNGPAPSTTSNMLDFSEEYTDSEALTFLEEYITTTNRKVLFKKGLEKYEFISKADREYIDTVIEKYGAEKKDTLIEMVHEFEAWKKHKITDFGPGQVADINLNDFFKNDGPVKQNSEEVLKCAQEYYHYGGV